MRGFTGFRVHSFSLHTRRDGVVAAGLLALVFS